MLCKKDVSQEIKDCSLCAGTGIYPGGLTYHEAIKNPEMQHFNDYLKKNGIINFHLKGVSYLLYHNDGKPRCLECFSERR